MVYLASSDAVTPYRLLLIVPIFATSALLERYVRPLIDRLFGKPTE